MSSKKPNAWADLSGSIPIKFEGTREVEPEIMYGLCHSIATDANAIAPALARALAEVSK